MYRIAKKPFKASATVGLIIALPIALLLSLTLLTWSQPSQKAGQRVTDSSSRDESFDLDWPLVIDYRLEYTPTADVDSKAVITEQRFEAWGWSEWKNGFATGGCQEARGGELYDNTDQRQGCSGPIEHHVASAEPGSNGFAPNLYIGPPAIMEETSRTSIQVPISEGTTRALASLSNVDVPPLKSYVARTESSCSELGINGCEQPDAPVSTETRQTFDSETGLQLEYRETTDGRATTHFVVTDVHRGAAAEAELQFVGEEP